MRDHEGIAPTVRPMFMTSAAETSVGRRRRAKDWEAPEIGWTDNPLRDQGLAVVGDAVQLLGSESFESALLSIPISDDELAGVDQVTLRVVVIERDGTTSIVKHSGFSVGLGYAWAHIDRPGLYAAMGLPADPFARGLLEELATRRQMGGGALRSFQDALRATDDTQLRRSRAAVAADRLTYQGSIPSTVEREIGGGIAGFRLPNAMSLSEAVARVVRAHQKLPEEQLLESLAVERNRAEAKTTAASPGPNASIDWWTLHADALRQGNVVGSHISRRTISGLRLRYGIPLDGPVVSVPAVTASSIYVGSGNSRMAPFGSGGTLYKLDLSTGEVQRRFTFPTPPGQGARQGLAGVACTPAVVNGRVFFSALNGCIYCLDAQTLAPLWITDLRHADPLHRQPVSHRVAATGWSSPLVIGNRVYVGFGESELETVGFVYCLDALTGIVVWLFCTCLMPGVEDNEPNVVPASMIGMPLPLGFRAGPEPVVRGASPWSSAAYDPSSNRIFIGTGSHPGQPLPQHKYCTGCLSLDASTGGFPRFFQADHRDHYRRDDDDTDFAAPPMIYSLNGRSVVVIGYKGGSLFLLDAQSMQPLARRQLLPRVGGNGGFPGDDGVNLPDVDPHTAGADGRENFYGIFGAAAVHPGLGRIFVGVGGFAFGVGRPGIDSASTAFMRALDWNDLTDVWPMEDEADPVPHYVFSRPPMYTTSGEAGFSSPVVVNDVVLVSTSRPACYAFDAVSGVPLWMAPGLGPALPNSFSLGPAVYGDFVVVTSANLGILTYSL